MGTAQTASRIAHDLGGAVWLGGQLMGAVGLNGASRAVKDPLDRIPVANAGWARWTPVSGVAMGAHLVGGLAILLDNRDRVATEGDVRVNTITKTVLTLAAVGTTAWSGVLGAKLAKEGTAPATSGVIPSADTPAAVKRTQQQLRALQWATPAMMGVVMGLGAQQGEQQQAAKGSPATRSAATWRKLTRRA